MPVTKPAQPPNRGARFLTMDEVAEELATTHAQVYALVRGGALPAIKVGGRGQWRIERTKLEEFIAKAYEDTARWVAENPLGGEKDSSEAD